MLGFRARGQQASRGGGEGRAVSALTPALPTKSFGYPTTMGGSELELHGRGAPYERGGRSLSIFSITEPRSVEPKKILGKGHATF
jgi:hypothetical protein